METLTTYQPQEIEAAFFLVGLCVFGSLLIACAWVVIDKCKPQPLAK